MDNLILVKQLAAAKESSAPLIIVICAQPHAVKAVMQKRPTQEVACTLRRHVLALIERGGCCQQHMGTIVGSVSIGSSSLSSTDVTCTLRHS